METLSGKTLKELEDFVLKLGESKFRAKQLECGLYKRNAKNFDEMTDLSKKFREKLASVAKITDIHIEKKQESKDGTIKYLLKLSDDNCVETVLMRYDKRDNLTACVSSQVGCAVGCKFCATAKRGFIRNLTPQEIVEQILAIQRDTGLRVTNVVYMGQGEPLLNLDNVMKSIDFINEYLEIGMRRITVSTSGIVDKIYDFAKEAHRQITLALSLHFPTSSQRAEFMPIENKNNLAGVMKALKHLTEVTGRRVTIEYLLIKGVNDSKEHEKALINLIKDLKCNINVIPYNEIEGIDLKSPNDFEIDRFRKWLEDSPKKVTVRLKRGEDIDAACGQLSGK